MKIIPISISLIIIITILGGCISDTNMQNVKKSNVISIEGKGDYVSIQEAIDAASENDTIVVNNGIYFEHIEIKKSITLLGEDKYTTIIDGNKSGDVIFVSADDVTISGFTIKNGGYQSGGQIGAGIDIRSNYNTISECNISSNKNYGLYLGDNIKNNIITFNTFSNNKDGIYTQYAKTNNISSNTFTGNTDYGIYLSTSSHDNLISDNIITESTYGLRVKGSERNTVTKNQFTNNNYGLYFCCGAPNNFAYNNIFMNNTNWHANEKLSNSWDNGITGNYWDDYQGLDKNYDGIGDTPYLINGNRGDRFPLMKMDKIPSGDTT